MDWADPQTREVSQRVKYQTGQLERTLRDKRGDEGTSYSNGNRTGQLKHCTGSLFVCVAQHLQIIYTAHYEVMNMNKLKSSAKTKWISQT